MHPRMMWPVLFLALAVAAGRPTSAAAPPLDLASLLEQYSRGQFDAALAAVDRANDEQAQALRGQWPLAGRQWIDASPEGRPARLLAAAAFALETENSRAEHGDVLGFRPAECAMACVLHLARSLLDERGLMDEPVRVWFSAAIALAQGVRETRPIHTPLDSTKPFGAGTGLASDALLRFPDDSRFRLDRAMAMAARYNITTEGARRSPVPAPVAENITTVVNLGTVTRMRIGGGVDGAVSQSARAPSTAEQTRAAIVAELEALVKDPVVGADAGVRLGYVLWATGDEAAATSALTAAAQATGNADTKYLAHFLNGWAALLRGEDAAAESAFSAALDARPHSQSATLGLATIEMRKGEADRGYTRAQASLAERPADNDPWRLFLYGRHHQLPALIARLREFIAP